MTTKSNPTYAATETQIITARDTVFGTAFLPTFTTVRRTPGIDVTAAKIPIADWKRIVTFLLWSQQTYHQEAMIHGYYHQNPPEGQPHWIIEPPNQEPDGMTVKACKVGEGFDENRRRVNELEGQGWVLRFTAHHHCLAAAGQSGTDKDDEHSKPSGFHVTLGNMAEAELSFHSRLVLRMPGYMDGDQLVEPAKTVQLDPPAWQFIETPVDALLESHPWLVASLKLFFLQRHEVDFPEAWKETIDVPLTAPAQASRAEGDCLFIQQIAGGNVVDMFNAVLKLGAEGRRQAFAGQNIPTATLPWGKTRLKKRRGIYDAMHRIVEFYVKEYAPMMNDGEKAFIPNILKAYVEDSKKLSGGSRIVGFQPPQTYAGTTNGAGGAVIVYGSGANNQLQATSHMPTGGIKKLRAPRNDAEWMELWQHLGQEVGLNEFKRRWLTNWDFYGDKNTEPDKPQEQTLEEQIAAEQLAMAQLYSQE